MKKLITVWLIVTSSVAFAQEHEAAGSSERHIMKGSHRLTVGLGHTHIVEGERDGVTQWLIAGSWSLNYDYWISNKWAIGLQNDIVLEDFKIEDAEKEVIERKRPLSVVPVGMFKPGKHFSMVGGVGIEFAESKNLPLTRLGVEYGFHVPKNWEVGVTLVWDSKWNYYDSWAMAFTFSKVWPKKHAAEHH